jgi:predicted alternative tryptophan synthase beta-subunit
MSRHRYTPSSSSRRRKPAAYKPTPIRAEHAEHALTEELRVYLKHEARDRTVRDVIAMCHAGHVRRLGGAS